MHTDFIEPRDGDVVVVRASRAPDGVLKPGATESRYAVIEWGAFQVVSERLGDLTQSEALLEARHCASERGRDAWDSTGPNMVRLPRLPLVYRGVADTFAVSLDVTDYSAPKPQLAWKSTSYLSESAALKLIVADGVPMSVAKALVGKAPMPDACA